MRHAVKSPALGALLSFRKTNTFGEGNNFFSLRINRLALWPFLKIGLQREETFQSLLSVLRDY